MNKKALFSLSYGLYIISAKSGDKENGCVANTLAQVTSSPERLSVTLNKNNYTTELVSQSGRFVGAVLTKDAEMNLIAGFGFRSGRDTDKFDGINTKADNYGIKFPTDGVSAYFSCKVINSMDLGTHVMFIGEIEDCEVIGSAESMTYEYYHKVKKGTTPKNAPSFQEEEPKKRGFKCGVCGYFLEAEKLGPDFKCPICGVGADRFKEI